MPHFHRKRRPHNIRPPTSSADDPTDRRTPRPRRPSSRADTAALNVARTRGTKPSDARTLADTHARVSTHLSDRTTDEARRGATPTARTPVQWQREQSTADNATKRAQCANSNRPKNDESREQTMPRSGLGRHFASFLNFLIKVTL